MKDSSDIGKLQYAINYPDSLIDGGTTKAYTNMKEGKNRLAKTVLYEKSIGEKSYYVVEAVPETKVKTLYIVSAFIGKPGYKKREVPQLIDAQGPDATSKNAAASASVGIISNKSESVNSENSEIKKSSRKVSKEFADKTLESFGITELNDSIHVQRKVLSTLEAEGFFTNTEKRIRTDVNEESGMVIETNKKGIYETFYRDNFNNLGKFKKIATEKQILGA